MGCGVSNANNLDTQVNIVGRDIIVTNGTTMDHNNRFKGSKDKTNIGKVTIGGLHLDKLSRMQIRKSTIIFVGGGMF